MKATHGKIVLFVGCVFIGILIASNINAKDNAFLSAEDYTKLYSERNQNHMDLAELKENYYKVKEKYDKYSGIQEDKYAMLSEIQNEYNENKTFLGINEVEGEGIKITLDDAAVTATSDYYSSEQFVHDSDIVYVINDLRNAGAEAISVNGQRVITDTYSYCGGAYIDFGGMKIVAPFYINAIGNKSVLKKYLILEKSHFKKLVGRGIKTDLQMVDNVKIPAYTGVIDNKYMSLKKK